MTRDELLQLIDQAAREGWAGLHLPRKGIIELPPEIGQLQKLRHLNLGGNKLINLPAEIGQLQNLKRLHLWNNQLSTLPTTIGQLEKLEELDIGANRLMIMPPTIGQLKKLKVLDLRHNQLTMVPSEISQLQDLNTLYIADNEIDILPEWLVNLPQLRKLFCYDNPITDPSPEVLGDSRQVPIDIDALRRYYDQLREEGEALFFEAKLLIIGEGGAGKTSLARKLQDPAAALPREEASTEGIDVIVWQFDLPSDYPNEQYHVNIWDFGGQAIYFATHQFFLTRRSVYVLVADTRQQHTDFYDWLRMQETFGGRSPVVLLKNRNRQKGNRVTIENIPQLRQRFANLKDTFELDLNDVPAEKEWPRLLQELKHRLLGLDHIGQPRPRTWVAVRRALQADERDTITRSQYLELCAQQGIDDPANALQLSQYLHNVGDILHFQDDPVLASIVILQPTWGLDAVYRVLDNPQIIDNWGRFSLTDLHTLWHEPKYETHHHPLLRLMQKFQLCYSLPGQPDSFIAPQLLKADVPDYTWDDANNLQLRYRYPIFMPRGILSRAIVKLHRRIEEQSLVWLSGVILRDDHARAELLELRGEKEIRIRVADGNKRDLLMEIVRALDDLHESFSQLHYERLIPCHCDTCVDSSEPHFFDLQELRDRLAHRKETIECKEPPYTAITIRRLLDDFDMPLDQDEHIRLQQTLRDYFDQDELVQLCFEMGIEAEDLPTTKTALTRELVRHCQRNGRLPELVERVRQKRPHVL